MEFKCPRCASTEYSIYDTYYVCECCSKRVSKLELEENHARINENVESFKKDIKEYLEENYQRYLLETRKGVSEEERVQLLNELKLDSKFLLEKGEEIAFAARIYSNIEQTLINKYGLRHEGKNFVITTEEYEDLVNSTTDKSGKGPLKAWDEQNKQYKTYTLTQIGPDKFEMLPKVRFLMARKVDPSILTSRSELEQACKMWSVLNYIRHVTVETNERLNNIYEQEGVLVKTGNTSCVDEKMKRRYLLSIADFFKKHHLCEVD